MHNTAILNGLFVGKVSPSATIGGCIDVFEGIFPQPQDAINAIEKKHIECLRKICYDKVFELCCHEMVRDELDVDPERSININYCIKCEYTELV